MGGGELSVATQVLAFARSVCLRVLSAVCCAVLCCSGVVPESLLGFLCVLACFSDLGSLSLRCPVSDDGDV